jgi:hypothetical protein
VISRDTRHEVKAAVHRSPRSTDNPTCQAFFRANPRILGSVDWCALIYLEGRRKGWRCRRFVLATILPSLAWTTYPQMATSAEATCARLLCPDVVALIRGFSLGPLFISLILFVAFAITLESN